MGQLSDADINAATAELTGWQHANGVLRRVVEFPSFLDGIQAVQRVAELAERADHHPDIDIRWRTVTFVLVTHSAGAITDKDLQLAAAINEVLGDR